ncbi:MAG TPA: DUF3320 domain-containing protein, partial [Beijerinckia sp.]|nr:DUF3320 domain-containing protein [Beijerinckia sp.]
AARQVTPEARLVEAATLWTGTDFLEIDRRIERLASLTASAGPLQSHVYFGVRRIGLQPSDFQRLIPQLESLAATASALAAYGAEIAAYFGLMPPKTLTGLRELVATLRIISGLPQGYENMAAMVVASGCHSRVKEVAALGARWQQHRAPYLQIFHASAWNVPVTELRAAIANGTRFHLARFGTSYREAGRLLASLLSVPLPRRPAERLALANVLLTSQKLRNALSVEASFLTNLFGDKWRDDTIDFTLLHAVAQIIEILAQANPQLDLDRVIAMARARSAKTHAHELETRVNEAGAAMSHIAEALDVDMMAVCGTTSIESIDLDFIGEITTRWSHNHARFEEWGRLAAADAKAREIGPLALVDPLASGALSPIRAREELAAAFAEASWKKALAINPILAHFDGIEHEKIIELFKELEMKRRESVVETIRARHQAAIPRGALGAMGVIRGEIGRRRSHMPLRQLMKAGGDAIQKIKPVFLMSPLSVAQYLPPGSVSFDLLVIDEASQLRPEDALGLIARCRQIVGVGDKKQLPPTSFFDRMIADEIDSCEEDETGSERRTGLAPVTDLESILSLCEARGLETQMLRWHYRSRHPSLIEVSNAEFYRHLVMPPAPATERKDKGLILRRVTGAYDRGGSRTNAIEAEAIACAVAEHARLCPDMSLGIVTFSSVQRDLINDYLEMKRRDDSHLDAFLREGKGEETFVKNLENVQGDERDVILISVGYGPRQVGKPLDSMAFGPISAEGGERRLNVLFTRARVRCEIFVSFSSSEINLDRATGEGPRVLKRFLKFAETGLVEENRPSGEDFDSPFEATVAAAIEDFGYKVDKQVGSAGFKIDLAVRDPAMPGRYSLAVECDGATYHSALWARERDRLRQEVLEGLGWRFHRVWSTDWFYRREDQLAKLKAALEAARKAPPDGPCQLQSGAASPGAALPHPVEDLTPTSYRLAQCPVPAGVEIPAMPLARLGAIVQAVIEQEGPIHQDEIARRVASLFGKERVGARIGEAIARALAVQKEANSDLVMDGEFWFTTAQKAAPPVRDRSDAPASLRKPGKLAPIEIEAATRIIKRRHSELDEDALPGAVAKLLGLQATKSDLRMLASAIAGRADAVFLESRNTRRSNAS